jgi:hypothetical protein
MTYVGRVAAVMLLLLASFVAPPMTLAQNAPSPTSGADEWTQDQHDAQHTGATSEEPNDAWTFLWSWNGADPNGATGGHSYSPPVEARTVTGDAKLFVPAGTDGLYAVALSNGQPAWHLASPAFNATPAYDPATHAVFAGSADGTLYKVDSVSGAILATYSAGSALNKSVVLADGFAYLASFDGRLHKVSTTSMTAAWVYSPSLTPVAEPIPGNGHASTPPAYSVSRDELVYATDDLFVHAVSNVDGSLKWHVKPTPVRAGRTADNPFAGQTFDLGWPVIADNHGLVLLRLQLPFSDGQNFPSPHHIWPNSEADAQSWLAANPEQQSLFALSLDSGAPAFIPAVGFGYAEGYESTTGDPLASMGTQPAVKTWPNGDEVAYVPFRNGQSNPIDWRWDGHLGEMVLDGSSVPGLNPGFLRFMQYERNNGNVGYSAGASYTFIIDEQAPISIAGASLFYAPWTSSDASRLTDRSTSLGTTYSNPMPMSRHSGIVRQQQACSTFDPITHLTTCGLTLFNDGRFWDGPGFWQYWNTGAPPNNLGPNGYTSGNAARYTYVSDGLIIVQGNAGDIFALKHS